MATHPAPATGPVECRPWCKHGDGHWPTAFAADQYCITDWLTIPAVLDLDEALLDDNGVEALAWHVWGLQKPGAAPLKELRLTRQM